MTETTKQRIASAVQKTDQPSEVDVRLNELAEKFGESIDRLYDDFNRLINDQELASLDIPMGRKEENVLNILHFECSMRMEE